ncbi:hypothetical protein JCM3775_002547 [Rhodotorula graminis]
MLATRLLAATARPVARPQALAAVARLAAAPPPLRSFSSTAHRLAVNPNSQQPASDSLKSMGQNAKEEVQGIARTVAEAVAGEANDVTSHTAPRKDLGASEVGQEWNTIKGTLSKVPRDTLAWGAAGLLPYAGTSLSIVYFARQAWLAEELGGASAPSLFLSSDLLDRPSRSLHVSQAQSLTPTLSPAVDAGYDAAAANALLEHAELLQIQYGAIILSFMGAVHWGFEWAKYGGTKGNRRYLLGVVPVLAGWGSLLIPGQMALVTQWGAFFAQWYMDQKATTKGWVPKWYATYRFWLTSIVGGSILLSLAATGYYGSSTEFAKRESQLKKLRQGKPPASTNPVGYSAQLGDMKAEKASDAYVKFTNVEKERQKKEEAEKQAKEDEKKAKEEEEQKKKDEEEAKKQAEHDSQVAAAVSSGKDKLKEQLAKVTE